MEREELIKKAELLKAIANPVRLCLITKLMNIDEANVTYFTNCMEVTQSCVSQHLAKLRSLNILGYRKDGQNVYYFLKDEAVKKIVRALYMEEKHG